MLYCATGVFGFQLHRKIRSDQVSWYVRSADLKARKEQTHSRGKETMRAACKERTRCEKLAAEETGTAKRGNCSGMVDGYFLLHKERDRGKAGGGVLQGDSGSEWHSITTYWPGRGTCREWRRAKFAKSSTSGTEKMERVMEAKESRGQRLVVRANPGDTGVACQWKCIMGIIL